MSSKEKIYFVFLIITLFIIAICGCLINGKNTKSKKQQCINKNGIIVEDRDGNYKDCILKGSDKE